MKNKEYLSKKEAVEFTGLDEKTFINYFKNAGEFSSLKREGGRGRFLFDKESLKKWLEGYKWRTIDLTAEDYALCLDFALAQHFRGYVLSDWGTARQREFGQKITNWVKGQLAEVAVKKFFKKEFNVDIELDFRIHKQIVPQDIISITQNGGKREPKIGVGIKSSKPKSAYLVLSENEFTRPERKSDVYIFCRPEIPDDHLLRVTRDQIIKIVKNQQHYSLYKDQIPFFENMPCEIAGYSWADELEKATSIPGQDFEGIRFVKKTGLLHRNRKDWEDLLKKL
ncbi:MAG: hypothetical protein PHI53_03020 [Candidatus Pacebacteria bacterium]|nr:hypothetical protein [Candidatus Paceibacterota bacterium]